MNLRQQHRSAMMFCLFISITAALSMTLLIIFMNNSEDEDTLSHILGYGYFACWSVSFLPQIYKNFTRKSVEGLSMDFIVLNFVGFSFLCLYTLAMYFSEEIKHEYRRRHDDQDNLVSLADVLFAVFALMFTTVTLAQSFHYPGGLSMVSCSRKPSRVRNDDDDDEQLLGSNDSSKRSAALSQPTIWFCTAAILSTIIYAWIESSRSGEERNMLGVLYFMSSIKMVVTLTKYTPQILMNCRRRSVEAWSMENTALDFAGGTLSVAQLILDAKRTDNWDGITGDPIKFGLGLVSMLFDTVFFGQYLYFSSQQQQQQSQQDDAAGGPSPATGTHMYDAIENNSSGSSSANM